MAGYRNNSIKVYDIFKSLDNECGGCSIYERGQTCVKGTRVVNNVKPVAYIGDCPCKVCIVKLQCEKSCGEYLGWLGS